MSDSDPFSIENRKLYELTADEARMVLDRFLRVEAEAFTLAPLAGRGPLRSICTIHPTSVTPAKAGVH